MNKVILDLASILIIGCIFTMCTHDADESKPDNRSEAKVADAVISFRIKAAGLQTYASTTEEEGTTRENRIGDTIEYYIFDADGIFETSGTLAINPEGSAYRSGSIEISAGDKYFYIFANKPAGLFTAPTTGSNRTHFEKQLANATFIQLFNGSEGFVMATLYGSKTPVHGNGTEQNPESIELTIGRMVAKVSLLTDQPAVTGGLKGDIVASQTRYGIINVPKKTYLIGQWEGPFKTLGSQVLSPHYYTYDANEDFSAKTTPNIGVGTVYYTMENTNEIPRNETATSFHLLFQYKPDASEIHKVNDPGQTGGTLDNSGSFWVAEFKNGAKLIYDNNPYGITHPDYGEVVKAYLHQYGGCYYIIPIEDDTEETASLRYATIRNHSYRLTVNSISGLGYHTADTIPDPTGPVKVMQGIDFKVYVKNWENVDLEVQLD